jgi:hypothetical protein
MQSKIERRVLQIDKNLLSAEDRLESDDSKGKETQKTWPFQTGRRSFGRFNII